eukprot:jgi/Mesvir1/18458/Mv14313-RA.1
MGFTPAVTVMAYRCARCKLVLPLDPDKQYDPDTYFESGNKNSVSFWSTNVKDFIVKEESKFGPFFETVDYWGIHRRRTALYCRGCHARLGYIMEDGPPMSLGDGQGAHGFGPSQLTPRQPRYRMIASAISSTAPLYKPGYEPWIIKS